MSQNKLRAKAQEQFLLKVSFMHVPKTAGTSLIQALQELKPYTVVGGFDRILFGDFTDFDSMAAWLRRSIYLDPSELPIGDMIAGHLAYSTLTANYPSHMIFTVMREPRCRLLSHWLFWRGLSDTDLDPWGIWAERVKLARHSFLEFMTARPIACQTDNVFVRMLLWPHALIPDNDFIRREADEELLNTARNTLSGFHFIGTIEDDLLPQRLGEFLNVRISVSRLNATRPPPDSLQPILADELDEDVLPVLQERSRLDAVLWSEIFSRYSSTDPRTAADRFWQEAVSRYVEAGVARPAS